MHAVILDLHIDVFWLVTQHTQIEHVTFISFIAESHCHNASIFKFIKVTSIIQMCSGITLDGVFSGEFYGQRFQKLIYLHLFTYCFMKISLQSLEQIQLHLHRRVILGL